MVDVPSPVLEKIIRTKYEAFGQTFDAALKKFTDTIFPLFVLFFGGFRWSDARLDWCGTEPFM